MNRTGQKPIRGATGHYLAATLPCSDRACRSANKLDQWVTWNHFFCALPASRAMFPAPARQRRTRSCEPLKSVPPTLWLMPCQGGRFRLFAAFSPVDRARRFRLRSELRTGALGTCEPARLRPASRRKITQKIIKICFNFLLIVLRISAIMVSGSKRFPGTTSLGTRWIDGSAELRGKLSGDEPEQAKIRRDGESQRGASSRKPPEASGHSARLRILVLNFRAA
jgi:hypothetical protein